MGALRVSFRSYFYFPLCYRHLGSVPFRRNLTRRRGANFVLSSPVYFLGCTIWVGGGVGFSSWGLVVQ